MQAAGPTDQYEANTQMSHTSGPNARPTESSRER